MQSQRLFDTNNSLFQSNDNKYLNIEPKNIKKDDDEGSMLSAMSYTTPSQNLMLLHEYKKKPHLNDNITIKESEEIDSNKSKLYNRLCVFSLKFWLLNLDCCLIYGCVVPWMTIGSSYMQNVYQYSYEKANTFLMIPYLFSAIATPIVGIYVDKIGRRCPFLLLSCILLLIAHIIFFLKINNEFITIITLILLGLSYSFFCAVIWPSFSLVVSEELLGAAYGIGTAGYNCVLGLLYYIVGYLIKETPENMDLYKNKFDNVQLFLFGMSFIALMDTIGLWMLDYKTGNVLDVPSIVINKKHSIEYGNTSKPKTPIGLTQSNIANKEAGSVDKIRETNTYN